MPWHSIKDEAKISAIIKHLISRQRKLKTYIDGEKEPFRSRIVKLNRILSEKREEAQLVIQRLDPAGDIELIRASSEVRMEFIVKKKFCKCKTVYIGPVYDGSDFTFLLTFPANVQVHEERQEARVELEMLEPVSVKITVGKESGGRKTYDLPVVDCSRHCLELLVTENEFDLFEELNVGDRIRDVLLYAPWAVTKVDGKVAHKTELQDGDHKGCFMLGIKSES
jgi:hypothetical protein